MKQSLAKVFVFSCAALLLLTACNEEQKYGADGSSSTVKFVIGGNTYQTKSSDADHQPAIFESIDISEETGIKGLTLAEEVSSLDDLYFNGAETKGTPIFTENIDQVYKQIAVTAYDGESKFANEVNYDHTGDYDGGKVYSFDYSKTQKLEWPDREVVFFFKAPTDAPGCSNIAYDASDNKITFEYESPATAAAQKDILFSSRHMTRNASYQTNRVLLYHALTGVKFKFKNDGGSDVTILSIDKVTFNNVLSKGVCTISPAYEDGGSDKSADVTDWDYLPSDKPATSSFSQSFTSTEQDVDLTDSDYRYPISFSGNTANTGNLNDVNASKTFMLIPQELTDDVTLTIEYKYKVGESGSTQSATTTIGFGAKLSNKLWQAGELHTYTLRIGDNVDVEIDDVVAVDETKGKYTKTDLTITNTGTATSYVRVAVIGNWFSDLTEREIAAGYPVAITACPELMEYIGEQLNDKDWILGGDEFFYYKYPVAGERTITDDHTLFKTLDLSNLYKMPADGGAKPYTNCHLELVFSVQAVRASELRLWTSANSYWDWSVVSEIKGNTATQD